jgi:hypothetical protein
MMLEGTIVITGSYYGMDAAEGNNSENQLVIRDWRLGEVYTENWWRHAHHSTPYRPMVPWWARVCVVCGSITGRYGKRWVSDMGEDG